MMRYVLPAAALLLCFTATKTWAGDVPVGVYDCYGRMAATGYVSERGDGVRSPMATGASTSASKFSVIAPGRYLSRGGTKGRFNFDGTTLGLVDGPYAGLRFHKVAEWSFRMLAPDGSEGSVMCPRNVAKDPQKPNAW